MRRLKDRFLKQPARGALKPAPPSDSPFVQKTLQKANQAAAQETSLDAFSKYLEKSSTGENKPSQPYARTRATKEVLGRDPLPNEFIEFDETFRVPNEPDWLLRNDSGLFPLRKAPDWYLPKKEPKSSFFRDARLMITNKRLIVRDLDNESRSIEITRSVIIFSTVTYKIRNDILFLGDELIIETGRKSYSIPLGSGVRARVEQLIPARAGWK
jgi:hypothetical protein